MELTPQITTINRNTHKFPRAVAVALPVAVVDTSVFGGAFVRALAFALPSHGAVSETSVSTTTTSFVPTFVRVRAFGLAFAFGLSAAPVSRYLASALCMDLVLALGFAFVLAIGLVEGSLFGFYRILPVAGMVRMRCREKYLLHY